MTTLGILAVVVWALALRSVAGRLFPPILRRSLNCPDDVDWVDEVDQEEPFCVDKLV